MSGDEARVGVLLSGRGSNFLALEKAMRDEGSRFPARIVTVISNQRGAAGLDEARALGLDAVEIPHRGMKRLAHEALVLEALAVAEVDWVCLAGYMRLLSRRFVESYPLRILNIHPSLLPAFPGLGAQTQALEHGVKLSGCTVHLVDAGLDSGPIVVQKAVAVVDEDTEQSLAARILELEHQAYPEALRRLVTEPWKIEGRRVLFGQ